MRVLLRMGRNAFRFANHKNRFARQIIEQRCELGLPTPHSAFHTPHFFEDAQFAAGWQRHGFDLVARNLCERVEMPQGFEFIAKKFQAHRPRTDERIHVENAAAQSHLALLRDLRFRFVTLFFKPFDQIKRFDAVAAFQGPCAGSDGVGGEGALKQGFHYPFPANGYIEKDGNGYRLVPAPWNPVI